MGTELSATELRILNLLIRQLPKVRPGYAPSYLGYKEAHEALGLEMHGTTYGISLQVQGLESLARYLRRLGAPALTGIVIDKKAGWPSHGYFNVHQRAVDDFQFWIDETAAAKRFDWAGLLASEVAPKETESGRGDDWLVQINWSQGVTETVDLQGVGEEGNWITTTEHWANETLPPATVQYRVFARQKLDGASLSYELDYVREQQPNPLALQFGRMGRALISFVENGVGGATWRDSSDEPLSGMALSVSIIERASEVTTGEGAIKNTLSLTKFLASLGCRLRIGWYWSAASEDRSRVIFTVWADQIVEGCYTLLPREDVYWKRLPGAYELRRHFPLAQMAGTEVYGVICRAVDEAAKTRKRAYFNEHELVRLRIEEQNGAWVALVGDVVDVEQLRNGRLIVSEGDAYDDLEAPLGSTLPERRDLGGGSRILRDAMVRRYVLRRAAGLCELCGSPGFVTEGGTFYLECHHVHGLAAGGADTVDNVIAVCANHHREAHYGADRVELNARMLLRIAEQNKRD